MEPIFEFQVIVAFLQQELADNVESREICGLEAFGIVEDK
jgi:hypothetical protein